MRWGDKNCGRQIKLTIFTRPKLINNLSLSIKYPYFTVKTLTDIDTFILWVDTNSHNTFQLILFLLRKKKGQFNLVIDKVLIVCGD